VPILDGDAGAGITSAGVQHAWHFRYDRRLSSFSRSVTVLAFSADSRWVIGGSGSGDMRVWDTRFWAEAAKLRGRRGEVPCCLTTCPAHHWLVSVQASALHVFQCHVPWTLEQSLLAEEDPTTGAMSEWCCAAFSPAAATPDHEQGVAGQDNHLAVLSTTHLRVLDYAGGWQASMPQRSHSLLRFARPTCVAYTPCGTWILCGNGEGQLQIWNVYSLTLEKRLSAHVGMLHSLACSPQKDGEDPRLVSCGADRCLCVWGCSRGWVLEQTALDAASGTEGVLACAFSPTGAWLLSVAKDLCIWRVCRGHGAQLSLQIHQRLQAIGSSEGLLAAAFGIGDAVVAGSRDGALGLWTRRSGFPSEQPPKTETAPPISPGGSSRRARSPVVAAQLERLPRPMNRVSPSPEPRPAHPVQEGPRHWTHRTVVRPVLSSQASATSLPELGASRPSSSALPGKPLVMQVPEESHRSLPKLRQRGSPSPEVDEWRSTASSQGSVPSGRSWATKMGSSSRYVAEPASAGPPGGVCLRKRRSSSCAKGLQLPRSEGALMAERHEAAHGPADMLGGCGTGDLGARLQGV